MSLPPHFLMSPPDYLRIPAPDADAPLANAFSVEGYAAYASDPSGFVARAQDQWVELHHTFLRAGAIITLVPPAQDAFDGAFVADASLTLWCDGRPHVLLSQFTNAPRAPEGAHHKACLQTLFGERLTLQQAALPCEGAGDVLYDPARKCLWAGYTTGTDWAGGRTQLAAHSALADFFGLKVHSLAVQRPFFHLDTCFAPLPGGQLLLWPEGLQDSARETLRAFTTDIICISREDAYAFACNVVAVAPDVLVTPRICDDLRRTLEHHGYTVLMADVSAFIACGGAVHCLTNPLHLGESP